MSLAFAGLWILASALPLIALVVAFWALSVARRHRPGEADRRLASLEERLRMLTERVWLLEQGATPAARPQTPPEFAPPIEAPALVDLAPGPPPLLEAPAPTPPIRATVDLEQRIGARWTTWVGVVALLFALSFFLRWAFENNLIGPGTRVILGLLAGVALLAGGLRLHRRPDLPYLSEGLAGGGLGMLYLSLYAAHAFYGLIRPGTAFALMFMVTVAGALVSVGSNRLVTAVLTMVGGLLTPILLVTENPDERTLFGYLLVLDLLIVAIARFRTWPVLNRLAWAGTALLIAPTLLRQPESPHPLTRLVLLSMLFLLFLLVPLAREWAERRRYREVDLALVAANAAGYFWAVYLTLEPWRPGAEGPYALALGVVYAVVGAAYPRRVPEDEPTQLVHFGLADVCLTLSIALSLHGPWITLAWAAQGIALLWVAPRVVTPIAGWGGLAALLLATERVLAADPYGYPVSTPVWNLTYLAHLLVVAGLAWAGQLASAIPRDRLRLTTGEAFRSALWVLSALVLAVLLWRELPGLWPAMLLVVEVLALGWLAGALREPAFVIAAPLVAAVLVARLLVEDDALARNAAQDLINAPLLVRIAGCAALALAGQWLARSGVRQGANVGRALSAAAAVLLLFVLSAGWTQHQDVALREARGARRPELAAAISWKTQVGLSVLWTLYAALALAWGFVRSMSALRYAALGLFGLVILKVFLVDLSEVQTVYRIVSFLILGVVLLGVSFLYQRVRRSTA